MRKLLGFIADSAWAWGILICIIVMLSGCAGISLKAPTTQILIKSPIFTAGYEIGKNIPPAIAKEIIHHSTVGEENVLVLYPNWKRYLSYRLTNPDHRRLIEVVLKAVDLSLVIKAPDKQEKVIRELFKEFISGLEAGIDSG